MADTIGRCLEAAYASEYDDFEVIVVDDNSSDNSLEVIKKFPCKLISLKENAGASKARNLGAQNSSGDIIFFTDADCLFQKDTLRAASEAVNDEDRDVIIGGTYTVEPYDKDFFSRFQTVFINYSETKKTGDPDYIATHAMVIDSQTFKQSDGFQEDFLPILEDVEFSHRLRKTGHRLLMNTKIQVQHYFNFSLTKSLINGFKKSRYWMMYSLKNRDLYADSGCASSELKFNVFSCFIILMLLASSVLFQNSLFLYPIPLIFALNIISSRGMLRAFHRANGINFAVLSLLYWTVLYPLPVGMGGLSGLIGYILKR